jgi:hypothetical protein
MNPHYLRLSGLVFSILLIVSLGVIWIGDAVAQPPTADFEPTYSPRQAAERVAAAQAAQQQERATLTRALPDAENLPFVQTVYFPQTGHHLSNRTGFLDFWRANGQVAVFGYPITEEIVENNRVVQYFERARFEYVAELAGTPHQVQLGLLGLEVLNGAIPAGVADPLNGARYFPETQHTLSADFRYYWERRGGLALFGYPLSEPYYENGRLVQYFERARFEYFPEDMNAFLRSQESYQGFALNTLHEVRLSDLGRVMAANRGINIAGVGQLPGAAVWSPALWQRHIDVNLSTQWLTAYEGELPVFSAPIATGRPGFDTPTGNYAIYDKLSVQTMQGSAQGESWYVPNIPWVMYVVGGVAMHGTYWHNAHGTGARPSHGCINLRIDDAQWLYEWADVGVSVNIHY